MPMRATSFDGYFAYWQIYHPDLFICITMQINVQASNFCTLQPAKHSVWISHFFLRYGVCLTFGLRPRKVKKVISVGPTTKLLSHLGRHSLNAART